MFIVSSAALRTSLCVKGKQTPVAFSMARSKDLNLVMS